MASVCAITSSVVVLVGVATWRVVLWRARTRLKLTADRVRELLIEDGPLIDLNNPNVIERSVLEKSIKRASKWMTLREELAIPLVGQVGGRSDSKKPLLSMGPEYVLKPLATDHRGIREIAFYEALEAVLQSKSNNTHQAYSQFLSGGEIKSIHKKPSSKSSRKHFYDVPLVLEAFDTLALALAIMFHDPVLKHAEENLREAWKAVKKEADALHRLSKFVPHYYGVVGVNNNSRLGGARGPPLLTNGTANSSTRNSATGGAAAGGGTASNQIAAACDRSAISTGSFGVTEDAYLLLSSLMRTYARPCVMDLKMGTQTYEPDCTEEKRRRESSKYPKQTEFGFRIIGMRVYDPSHDEADDKGFRLFSKHYGRSLLERDQVKDAFRLFFRSGLKKNRRSTNTAVAAAAFSMDDSLNGSSSSGVGGNDCKEVEQRVRTRAISNILLQLRSLRRWFEENNSLQFRASSLLIVYEGDPIRGNGDVTMLKMIDFGHVRRVPGGDGGYLTGIKNLTKILTEILYEDEEDDAANQRQRGQQQQQQQQFGINSN